MTPSPTATGYGIAHKEETGTWAGSMYLSVVVAPSNSPAQESENICTAKKTAKYFFHTQVCATCYNSRHDGSVLHPCFVVSSSIGKWKCDLNGSSIVAVHCYYFSKDCCVNN